MLLPVMNIYFLDHLFLCCRAYFTGVIKVMVVLEPDIRQKL